MDIFDSLETTDLGAARPDRIPEGISELTVEKIISMKTRDKKMAFIVEFKDQAGKDVSWYQDMSREAADGNIKRFFYAVLGVDPNTKEGIAEGKEKIDPRLRAIAIAATSEDQKLSGRKVRVEVREKPTKAHTTENPRLYRHHKWMPAED